MKRNFALAAVFGLAAGAVLLLALTIPGEVIVGAAIAVFGLACFITGVGATLVIVRLTQSHRPAPENLMSAPQPSILVLGGQAMPYTPPFSSPPALPEQGRPRRFTVIGSDDEA